MAEYTDHVTQRAYEEGVRDALGEREPWEPDESDREWFDGMNTMPNEVQVSDYTRDEIDQMQRDEIADAIDEQWNWPHR